MFGINLQRSVTDSGVSRMAHPRSFAWDATSTGMQAA
jgi:hypothetical protein